MGYVGIVLVGVGLLLAGNKALVGLLAHVQWNQEGGLEAWCHQLSLLRGVAWQAWLHVRKDQEV